MSTFLSIDRHTPEPPRYQLGSPLIQAESRMRRQTGTVIGVRTVYVDDRQIEAVEELIRERHRRLLCTDGSDCH